jgi:hypothetical protein
MYAPAAREVVFKKLRLFINNFLNRKKVIKLLLQIYSAIANKIFISIGERLFGRSLEKSKFKNSFQFEGHAVTF